ncbi:Hydantoin racemase [Cupriavidus taiwanensis]|uniref:Hydantoin racemase n=1 Tax=Cupriavidus taiwanensis TaxID=164546 RepID=A0A375EEV5_9BURK|nr:aspartate/glutamate racemase family protein [Cupriavidus taiwanensis]SOZ73141.1 Hydantoin racemase [Cupriavidus taiwanensis]SOZ73705.1 Hydantoin racemase [Cupriavidus taiwanensis]SOZ75279.1 Hydantoin racemase [Cupriavidus taiwanensis]SPA03761.1 Hydantoin racemase [Cupriavidus taiwanensis]SPA12583.1 Hydantoin racemase [Cupriavidus taiwanensis]
MTRIQLIHATAVAIPAIAESFQRLWPEAETANLLDDSLSDALRDTPVDAPLIIARFKALTQYGVDCGAEGILFTCSAFGAAIEAAQAASSVPVLKPNEAMIDEALFSGTRIALVATFEPAIASITQELEAEAAARALPVTLESFYVPEALDALRRGDQIRHDTLVAQKGADLARFDVICFAQFSMTSAAQALEQSAGRPVLTTPDSAVKKLRGLLG